MKESLIGLYVDNTEVPEYKSAGASGFDLRAKFNPKIPWFDKSVIGRILNENNLVYTCETHKQFSVNVAQVLQVRIGFQKSLAQAAH